MNVFNSKTLISFLGICVAALLLSIAGCKGKLPATLEYKEMDPAFSSYIYAYSSGIVSRAEPILVRFNDMVVSAEQIGESVEKLISFSPSISGSATWEDTRTLKFTPDKPLPSQSKYEASVNLSKIFDNVPGKLKEFEFAFLTKHQQLNLNLEGLQYVDENDLSRQQLTGIIRTADYAENEKVEEILDVSQSGNRDIAVVWTHSADQQEHKFVVDKVKRGSSKQNIAVNWNGKAIGVSSKGKEEVEVPPLGVFKVTSAKVIQDKEQYVLVTFSDPLQKSQNLDGLVKIQNVRNTPRYTIDGNRLMLYPGNRVQGEAKVTLYSSIKNSQGANMGKVSEWNLAFEAVKPSLRLVGKGVILPNSEGLIFPFEAVSLQSVEVEIFKIYENNILQFLQNNEYGGNYNLRQVGRVVHRQNVSLAAINPTARFDTWTRYALDLSDMVEDDPAAIYQVRLGFYKNDSSYPCGTDGASSEDNLTVFGNEEKLNEDGEFKSIWEGDRWYWDYEGYDYDHRDNPCYPPYYQTDHFIRRNIIASDLGIIAKRGNDGSVFAAISNLITTDPMKGTEVEFYDYQQQLIAALTTDAEGVVMTELKKKPFFVVAKSGDQRGYLKMDDGSSLSLSRFDVGGNTNYKGIKGFLYGERGVWRPGDSIYLTFILEDKLGKLPKNHPVTLEFRDPKGQVQGKFTKSKNTNNMYRFSLATDTEDPTGNWTATAKIGGAKFSKNIKIEAVKPNRLKIKLDFGKEELVASDKSLNGKLQVNWLHGAPAKDLRTEVKVQLRSITTKFSKYNDFIFDDPARSFNAEPQTVYDKAVDENGRGNITATLETNDAVPGKLKAYFTTRAFEKGGDFSTDNFSMEYNPYDAYVGIRIPTNKYGYKEMNIGKDNKLEFVMLDKDGEPLRNKELNVGLYRVNWRWWWDSSRENVASYSSTNHHNATKNATITTNRNGEATWSVQPEDWGRFLVRVCDPETGHCTGDKFFAGYPWGDDAENNEGATMLSVAANQKKYNVGETIKLNVPTGNKGRILVTLENGTKVIETRWVDASKGETDISFYATEAMTPTVYAHVALLQPHGQKENDLPMRMYGVIPLRVENEATRLEPEIAMADVLKPEETFNVKVSEKSGRAMAYTIAMVDDGLLDLTRFKTPNPWDAFYAREALGVKTWDMFDYVLGAYGGDLERILSIGGDEEAEGKKGLKANRFKPVVRYYGPFYLKKGETASHDIDMPNYVGSVRTMVVAADKGAYGNAEKTSPVRQPLMVLGTLPRVLSPTEKVKLPVSVFAMDKTVKNVTVKIEANELFGLAGPSSKQISFDKPGDDIIEFDLNVKEGIGIGKVKIVATSGNNKTTQEIELDVRNPNPYVTDILTQVIDKGESWNPAFNLVGMSGTNSGIIEVSNIPPVDLGRRLKYLIRYPHGCIEQTTSSGFPQLYVDRLIELNEDQKKRIPENIQATIDRLKSFQVSSGGFAYWPGNDGASHWGTNYAGHFILEAKKLGYNVPDALLNNWKKYQKAVARNWSADLQDSSWRGYRSNAQLMQSYRLYTLALAGAAELGAMNRLREVKNLSNTSKWRLAAAYAAAGKVDVAKTIVGGLATDVEDYRELSYTYGSGLRDRAMILETLLLIDRKKDAAEVAKRISESLSSQNWYGTQTVAYCLLSIGKFVGDNGLSKKFEFAYSIGDKQSVSAGSKTPIFQAEFNPDEISNKTAKITNNSSGILYARLIMTGQPLLGDQSANSSKLDMEVAYTNLDGSPVNPDRLVQGTDFIAEVRIKNPGLFGHYKEMALTQVFPSGWEIHNARMNGVQGPSNSTKPTYQDIRDDRVMTYFDIREGKGQTYRIQLNAAYQGKYFLPTTYCEAMYDNTINARLPGKWIEVLPPPKGS